MSNTLSKYSARIKDVYIELKDYQFFHSPYSEEKKKKDSRFIGRNKAKERIISILKNTSVRSGSYLITGFRGMGKTSLIRQAINEYNIQIHKDNESNFLTVKPNLRVFKRFLGYSIGFLLIILLIKGDETRNAICLGYFAVGIILIFFHILLSIPNYTRDEEGKNKDIYTTTYLQAAALHAFYFLIIFFSIQWFDFHVFTFLIFYFVFLFINLLLLDTRPNSPARKISNAAWDFFKVVFIACLNFGLIFYFFNHRLFCEYFNCFDVGKNIMDSIFYSQYESFDIKIPIEQFSAKTRESQMDDETRIAANFNKSFGIIRLVFSIVFAYIILTAILFCIDLISQALNYLKYIYNSKKNKEEENSKNEEYQKFEINLSQESLNEIDLLRRMTYEIDEFWTKNRYIFTRPFFDRKVYFVWRFLLSRVNFSNKNDEIHPTFSLISAKLRNLKNRLSGEVTSRKELKLNPSITTGITKGLTRIAMPLGIYSNKDEIVYPIANAKEAEDQLVSILKDIDEFRKNSNYKIPQFAFIIDELDKIEPHRSVQIQEKEYTNPALDTKLNVREPSRFRQRQQAVAKLLANLKGFLNVGRAKFFFIGGREMFDADLADIADRDSFYSSIFNHVIYIDSFFKDSTNAEGKGGITQMTETYLCNIILNNLTKKTNGEELENAKLITLSEWLTVSTENNNCLDFDRDNKTYISQSSNIDDETKKKAYKVLFLLQNYIIFLTYRSNGTPKKLTALTEQLMVLKNKEEVEQLSQNNLVVLHKDEKKKDRVFLKFGFNTQYEIGLTANIYRPYLIANSRHLKTLGDKLLFSSAFIIDHILKFHPFGFSWRNLELIPEVVLVNREPNLRNFIEELMRFYSMTYIRSTISGIFTYRFRSIIRREMIFLSKTSDLSAAAFNFTLDESLATKRHYKKILIELRDKYKAYRPITSDNLFVHSLCFAQTVLGDLHFYDKEYDEAILYYTESIQSLRFPNAIEERVITRHQFYLWLRNQLKLGLTLEKIRAFDSAFTLYKTLMLDTKEYMKKIVNKKQEKSTENTERGIIDTEDHRTIHTLCMPFVAFLGATEKIRTDGITYTNLERNRKDFYDTILQSYEKVKNKRLIDEYRRNFLKADYYSNVGSILYYKNCQFPKYFEDENYWLDSFQGLCSNTNVIAIQQHNIFDKKIKREYDYFPSLAAFNYYWNALYFLLKHHRKRIIEVVEKQKEYKTDFTHLMKLKDNLLALSTGLLLPECVDMFGSTRLFYTANVISKIGDSILASLKKENFTFPEEAFEALDITGSEKGGDKKRIENINKFCTLVGSSLYSAETVLHIYKLAAALYKRAGHNANYSAHLLKILYLIKDLIEINKVPKYEEDGTKRSKYDSDVSNFKESIKMLLFPNKVDETNQENKLSFDSIKNIAKEIFRATTWNNLVSNRPQILKYRSVLGIENRDQDRHIIYNNLNNTFDNREALILVEGIKLKLGKYFLKDKGENFIGEFKLSKSIISAYGSINNRYVRMLELKYRSERCFSIMKRIMGLDGLLTKELPKFIRKDDDIKNLEEILGEKGNELSIYEIVAFLIEEALFCLRELIKMIKLYDPGYVIGYMFMAEAHSRMGDWCHAFDNFREILSKKHDYVTELEGMQPTDDEKIEKINKNIKSKKEFVDDIEKILGSESTPYLESKNHYESSIQYFYKTIQLHTDGKAYNDKLHDIYMLEDDYNDSMAHYIIASERLRINTGKIREKIQDLTKKIDGSKLYEYGSYLTLESKTDDKSGSKTINPPDNNYEEIKSYLDFFAEEL